MDRYLLFLTFVSFVSAVNSDAYWRWECIRGYCQKLQITPDTKNDALSLPACRLFCSKYAAIWPQPTGDLQIGNYLAKLNLNSIDLLNPYADSPIGDRIRSAGKRFLEILDSLEPKGSRKKGGKSLMIIPNISNVKITRLYVGMNEGYSLAVQETSDGRIKADITADTYFGFRHGLETLSQLVIYDDIRDEYQMVRDFSLDDMPKYTYRGILLDTSRNYVSVATIKRTLEGMALSKLNTFHWHITDSHSFPYVSKSRPQLSKIGAYSRSKVYTPEDVADIIEYGLIRGIRVLPELDAPAHVGEGWQDTGFLTCFNAQPWSEYCVEPPCGQLNPVADGLYDYLEGIYHDMAEQFDPDLFHMGGDEVSFKCWNATPSIIDYMTKKGWGRSESDFIKLWSTFQSEAMARYIKHERQITKFILWTSTLTGDIDIEEHLPKNQYIIQIWTSHSDDQIRSLLQKGYKIILSNYDALYLDCGFSSWVAEGNNWCSPYIGWQIVYDNSPAKIAGQFKDLVMGSEATLWSEQVDDTSIDSRLWPRAAALAERLWAEPDNQWKEAEQRILIHRERLVRRGVQADALEPEWCIQNEENCPLNGEYTKH